MTSELSQCDISAKRLLSDATSRAKSPRSETPDAPSSNHRASASIGPSAIRRPPNRDQSSTLDKASTSDHHDIPFHPHSPCVRRQSTTKRNRESLALIIISFHSPARFALDRLSLESQSPDERHSLSHLKSWDGLWIPAASSH